MTTPSDRPHFCGWCTAPEGARIPHRRGVPCTSCDCPCHDKKDED